VRLIVLTLLTGLAGCAAAPVLPPPGAGAQSALFENYPDNLLAAARSACSGPLQTARIQRPDGVICETLPTPEAAAALIIEHNGTVEKLPSYIIRFHVVDDTAGTIVVVDNYIRVPQRDGMVVQVRLEDEGVTQSVRALLAAAGGTLLATPNP